MATATSAPTPLLRFLPVLLIVLLPLSSCDDEVIEAPAEVADIEVTPASSVLEARGATRQLTAIALDGQGGQIPDVSFTWSSDDPAVATVDGTGLVTAQGEGDAEITAAADGITGSATVAVQLRAATVDVAPAQGPAEVRVGESLAFQAQVLDANGNPIPGANVSWSSSDQAVATVDASGTATGQAPGTAEITAESGGVTGSAVLTVTAAVGAVAVTPESTELQAIGATAQLDATVTDDQGNPIDDASVEWSSSDDAVATVDDTGLVTAQGNGMATVTASVGEVSGTATVTVSQVVANVVTTPEAASVEVGGSQTFTAAATDANGNPVPDVEFAWSSSDEAVATVDQSGNATGQAPGTATITAASGGVTGTATLEVTVAVGSVEVTPPTTDLTAIGATVQLTATVLDTQGNPVDDAVVTWSSSDAAVASVDDTGLVSAQGDGTATVTASVDGVSGTATVTVSQEVSTVTVTPAMAEVEVGATQQFTATAEDANGNEVTGATFTWTSDDETVATVDGAGLATGVAEGTATITASTGGVSDMSTLTVVAAPTLALVSGDGQTGGRTEEEFGQPLIVQVTDGNGDPVSGRTVDWSITSGGGALSQTSTTTDDQGQASVTVTAGQSTGVIRVEATAPDTQGGPITFDLDVSILRVEIVDNAFVDPQGRRNTNFDVTVRVGDTIEWLYVQQGNVIHTATSTSEPAGGASFDSGNLAPGDTFSFTPQTAGTWTFFCEIHPNIMLDSTINVVN